MILEPGAILIDASMLRTAGACLRKYYIQYLQHLTAGESSAAQFGIIFHRFLSRWYQSQDILHSIEAFSDWCPEWDTEKHSLLRLRELANKYIARYNIEPWEIITNEIPLRIQVPLPEGWTCDRDIYLIGIIDLLIRYDGWLYGVDHKTTGILGDMFFRQFKPDIATAGYHYYLRQVYGSDVQGLLINAISTALKVPDGNRFKRQLITRTSSELADYPASFCAKVLDLYERVTHLPAADLPANTLPVMRLFPPNESSCMDYGGCCFREYCAEGCRPDIAESFKPYTWNPLDLSRLA